MDRLRRVQAFRAAAQDHGVARLQAQRAGVGGDVRTAFEDHADDAERRADPADVQARRPVPFGDHLPHRVGLRRRPRAARRPSPAPAPRRAAAGRASPASGPSRGASAMSSALASSSAARSRQIASAAARERRVLALRTARRRARAPPPAPPRRSPRISAVHVHPLVHPPLLRSDRQVVAVHQRRPALVAEQPGDPVRRGAP